MLPKKGTVLPPGGAGSGMRYADVVALALKTELGETHRAVKTVRQWTGASERAVKNWFAGATGPNGDYLIRILHRSDIALEMILAASRRVRVLELLLCNASQRPETRDKEGPPSAYRSVKGATVPGGRRDDPDHGPDRDPDDVPEPIAEPNERQQWFLSELAESRRVTAQSLEQRFGVSKKTAKRDIADLKRRGALRFVGSRRAGRYRLGPNASPAGG